MAYTFSDHCIKIIASSRSLLATARLSRFMQNIARSASDSAYSYPFLRSVVCLSLSVSRLSAVRYTHVNRSTDLDAIWQA